MLWTQRLWLKLLTLFRRERAAQQLNDELKVGDHVAATHQFYTKQKDGTEHLDATAKFTEIWTKASGSWKLVRVISYDHQ